MKKKLLVALSLLVALGVTACGAKTEKPAETGGKDPFNGDNKIVVAVSPVPHAEIIEALEPEFKAAGLNVEPKIFNDYVQPNLVVADKQLDANFFQHKPYLDEFSKQRKIELSILGYVHVEPMAVYSTKYKDVKDIPEGSEILIPNDVTNGARALILLEKAGLIKMKDSSNINATVNDIAENPNKIKFTVLDAATIPKTYGDVAAGVINANFALGVNLNPKKDSIFAEGQDSPYKNLVAVRKGDENLPKFKKFMEILNSEKAKKFIEEQYKGNVFPAF